MDRVFICYSRKDSDFVDAFVHDLNMEGVNTWYDVNDIPRDKASNSQSWRRAVDRALRECTHMIVVLSPNSVGSEEVEAEWNYFLKQKRPLFPIIHLDCDVPYRLDALNWTDFRYNYEAAFNALITLLPYSPAQPLHPPAIKPASDSYPSVYEDISPRRAKDWLGIPLSTWVVGGGAALVFLVITIITVNSWLKADPPDGTPTLTGDTTAQPTDATQDVIVPTDQPTSAVTETPTVTLTEEPTEVVVPTPIGGGSGKIAFVSGEFANSLDIFQMSIDGSGLQNLTNSPSNYQSLVWSPDGSQLAFVSAREGNDDIYVMNVDGSNPINLTNIEGNDSEPAWSPDGTQLAFRSERGGGFAIWIMGSDGSNPVNLTPEAATYDDPIWSPDGTRIAFTLLSSEGSGSEIYVMNADGSNLVNITNQASDDRWPAWSPDSSQIAFVSDRVGNSEVYVMGADGSIPANLTNHESADSVPAWSPDGTRIAFTSDRDGDFEIYMINPDGTNLVQITNNDIFDTYPTWQPVPIPVEPTSSPLLALIFDFASYLLPKR